MSRVTCSDFERLYDARSPGAAEQLSGHLADCATCRVRWGELRAISDLAQGLRRPIEAEGLWECIDARLLSEQRSRRRTPPSSRWIRILLPASAAAVLLVLALVKDFDTKPMGLPSPILKESEAKTMAREQNALEREFSLLGSLLQEKASVRDDRAAMVIGQLAYLDSNIRNCRRLVSANDLNAGLRRSLLDCTRMKIQIVKAYLSP